MDEIKKVQYTKISLPFNFPAGTSRGILHVKKLWVITLCGEGKTGIGECSIIEGLTPEYVTDHEYENRLENIVIKIQNSPHDFKHLYQNLEVLFPELIYLPSIRFGFETALRSWLVNSAAILFENEFTRGTNGIPINGLIWMGPIARMKEQIEKKLREGFNVLKFKIAALPWEQERELLASVRNRFPSDQLEIRVDANGGLTDESWPSVFADLESLEIHSIEQPLLPANRDGLIKIAQKSSIPMALDESLIQCFNKDEKLQLLKDIMPQYIILKPSLMGGFKGVSEWITMAESLGIRWWITSALESNIGLSAIAQFTAEFPIKIPQGLGTGGLFTRNFLSPLFIEKGVLKFQRDEHSKTFSQLA